MFQNRRRSKKLWISKIQNVIILICLISPWAVADEMVSCNDGDTCRIKRGGKKIKIRLAGIDAPETGQDNAESSKNFLIKQLKGKKITLDCVDESMNRENCYIFVGKTDIQREMVKAGWAFDYPKYSNGKYKLEQDEAKKSKKGIWSNKNLVSPYCYRYVGVDECKKDQAYQP